MHEITIEQNQQFNLYQVSNELRFKGVYLATAWIVKYNKAGEPYSLISLSDSTSTVKVYCFLPEALEILNQPNPVVQVDVCLRQHQGEMYFKCELIEFVPFKTLTEKIGITALPCSLCPKPGLLKRLNVVVAQISSQPLKTFLCDTIMQEDIALRYITCPASLNYHHNYAGGLLEHSVEVAENLATDKSFSSQQKDLSIVTALLHDIGKTKTLTSDLTRTAIGYLIDHDQLTLEICAVTLKTLDKASTHLSAQTRHIMTCSSPGARYGFKPQLTVALRLQDADRQSAKVLKRHVKSLPVCMLRHNANRMKAVRVSSPNDVNLN
jgi:3'-5' exoribonuclease